MLPYMCTKVSLTTFKYINVNKGRRTEMVKDTKLRSIQKNMMYKGRHDEMFILSKSKNVISHTLPGFKATCILMLTTNILFAGQRDIVKLNLFVNDISSISEVDMVSR